MFTLVIYGLDTSQILGLDFYHIRDCGYDLALHFNEGSGLFNLGIAREEAFSLRIADNKIYLTGDLEIEYYGSPIYYLEEDLSKAIEEWEI